ncbi:hypothetical protein OEIGOIKO_02010 [Streptomyces chrestomyceticus JCM 4735]|uniref:Uncharacterized protein n=1 Tax=Streptomyces chrestomyceticus JCM 4735 TaxID=1306181 RepID=A0A7U9KUI5_9ACTN|nr:hypothetical protein OEIGOIKO_02010 [Streptomyces chrestomyceticus JCM 4735]
MADAGVAAAVTRAAEPSAAAAGRVERIMANLLRTAPPRGGAGGSQCPVLCRADITVRPHTRPWLKIGLLITEHGHLPNRPAPAVPQHV